MGKVGLYTSGNVESSAGLNDRNTHQTKTRYCLVAFLKHVFLLPESPMSKHKRKKNFVDNKVQGALLRRIFSHWLLFFAVAGGSVLMLQTLLGDSNVPVMDRLKEQIGEFTLFAIVMAALFPGFMLDTVRFSNRFVGPIGRLRRHLQQLSRGDTSECSFRGDDFWIEAAAEFNAVADLVKSQKEEIERLRAANGGVASPGVSVDTTTTNTASATPS